MLQSISAVVAAFPFLTSHALNAHARPGTRTPPWTAAPGMLPHHHVLTHTPLIHTYPLPASPLRCWNTYSTMDSGSWPLLARCSSLVVLPRYTASISLSSHCGQGEEGTRYMLAEKA